MTKIQEKKRIHGNEHSEAGTGRSALFESREPVGFKHPDLLGTVGSQLIEQQ